MGLDKDTIPEGIFEPEGGSSQSHKDKDDSGR